MINWDYLRAGVADIHHDQGPYLAGRYSSLSSAVIIPPARDAVPPPLRLLLQRAGEDLWDALTVMWRVEWQREMARAGHLDQSKWMYFVGADVRELHVALRSFYDSVCRLLTPAIDRRVQAPQSSFQKLRRWLALPGNHGRLGADLATHVAAAGWFSDLCTVRDGLVHDSWRPLVFPQLDRIGFQVHGGAPANLRFDAMMINENIVDLELYSAVQVGQAIGLLQCLSGALLVRFGLPDYPAQVKAYHPGLGFLRASVQRLE